MGGLFCLLNVELVLGWSPVVCLLRGTKMSNWQEGVKNSQKDERESTIWGVVGEEDEETSCHAHHVYKMLRFGVGGVSTFSGAEILQRHDRSRVSIGSPGVDPFRLIWRRETAEVECVTKCHVGKK